MKKKIVSMMLVLCLVLCLLPAGAAANPVMGLIVNDVDVSSAPDPTEVSMTTASHTAPWNSSILSIFLTLPDTPE